MLSDIKRLELIDLPNNFDIRLQESIDNYNSSKIGGFNIFKLFNNPLYATMGAISAIMLIFDIFQILNMVYNKHQLHQLIGHYILLAYF